MRVSHAKAHGFLKGELIVRDNLPPELAQGLFAQPRSYPVLVRLAQVPGEMLDDCKVSTPRGISIKVFDVAGPKLPGHEAATQDFLLDTGKAFIAGGAKAFLAAFTPNATIAPKLAETVKSFASSASLAANAVLNLFGLNSAKLDFYGHPRYHPLGESYYLQAHIRYGDYVAKIGTMPANDALRALHKKQLSMEDENALRTATVDFFRAHEARYDVGVQLATDLERMPIEDASVEWPEDLSPYRTVAQLVLPSQDAYDSARQQLVDYNLSFTPNHSLVAHRPLGSLMRARLAVYPVLSKARRHENQKANLEPVSLESVPG